MAKRIILIVIIASILVSIGIVVFMSGYESKKVVDDILDEAYMPAIRIYVHNGSGFRGVANNVRQSVFGKNIEVVGVGNTRKFIYDETVIVVKHDDETELIRLKRMTGVENVIYAVNSNYYVPFIIIAGRDYQRFFRN